MLQLPSLALCPFFVTSRVNLLKTLLVLVPLLPLYCSSSPCSSRLILLDCRYYQHYLLFVEVPAISFTHYLLNEKTSCHFSLLLSCFYFYPSPLPQIIVRTTVLIVMS